MKPFHPGDLVRLKADQRHPGRVVAIIQGKVRVKWQDTTWISDENPQEIEHVTK